MLGHFLCPQVYYLYKDAVVKKRTNAGHLDFLNNFEETRINFT